MEDRVQNVEQVLSKMIKVMNQQDNKLLDQEGRSRRENRRIYNVPEGAEGPSLVEFVQKLLRETMEVPTTTELGIKRAHRALAPRPSGEWSLGASEARPHLLSQEKKRIKNINIQPYDIYKKKKEDLPRKYCKIISLAFSVRF